jgi:alpha-amylase/alpha-mannosidase (GH57 family)
MPRVVLPEGHFHRPEDARAQSGAVSDYFKQLFGFTPQGMWPSEGSVSNEALEIIIDQRHLLGGHG